MNAEVAYDFCTDTYERSQVLLAQGTDGLWRYSHIFPEGGSYPNMITKGYSDRGDAVSDGKQSLLTRMAGTLRWYQNANKGKYKPYGPVIELYNKHIAALTDNLSALF